MKRAFTALVAVVVVMLSACADEGAAPGETSGVEIVTTTTTPPTPGAGDVATTAAAPPTTAETADGRDTIAPGTGASTSSPPTSSPTSSAPPTTLPSVGDPVVAIEPVAEFARPVDLAVRPGDPSFHIVNQGGTIVRFDLDIDAETVTLDVSDRISGRGEQGLLGLEFSPTGELAYVNFTDTGGDTVVAEYAVRADGVLDPATERILLTVDQPYGNHNAGDLAVGPDGYLYVTLGDGGSGGDPERRASDPTSLLGSLLRIDPTPSGDAPYSIPSDNPFASGSLGDIEGAPEVWSWGLRNPWKIAFDPPTGRLWIPDVGQNRFEEVNVVGPVGDTSAGWGVDFGWSAFEGTERFNDDVPETGRETFPVLTYEHGEDRCSVSGGAVYRGSAIPDLVPAFVFSDFCSGIVWAYDLDGARVLTLLDGLEGVTAVRVGPDGELYVLQAGGELLRLVPG